MVEMACIMELPFHVRLYGLANCFSYFYCVDLARLTPVGPFWLWFSFCTAETCHELQWTLPQPVSMQHSPPLDHSHTDQPQCLA
jgi:hypothetical protein